MMGNIIISADSAGNIKADKEKSSEKIDGGNAAIIELNMATKCGNEIPKSVYDSR